MRLLLGALVFVVLAMPGLAHEQGEHVGHMNLVIQDLEPGATNVHPLSFDEMGTTEGPVPLREGWLFALVIAQVGTGTPLQAAVKSENGTEAGNWTLATGQVNKLTALLPETGEFRVHVANPGNNTTRYAFYFDQSCNCAGKPLPRELPGLVIFNVDGRRGDRIQANFPEPPAVRIKVTAATLANDRAQWPQDFRALETSTEPNQVQANEESPPVPIHELRVRFDATERVYFIVEPDGPNAFDWQIMSMSDVLVTPFYDKLKEKDSPAASAVLVLLLVALFLAGRRPS